MIGQTVSHYKILEELGGGGMGVVYTAEDTRLKRIVALKFLSSELTGDESARERIIQEAQAASSLDHPNICTIHEVDEAADGRVFICMSHYEGGSIKDRLARGPLPLEDAIDVAVQVAEGLAAAHGEGIVHRDIKPANLMLTKTGTVKIVDFGVAKTPSRTKQTKTGSSVGTSAYMSPEQTKGQAVDQRSDIWSLGVVLYELLSGHLPFRGEYDHAMAYSIVNEDPAPLAVRDDAVGIELKRIASRALAKKPAERYEATAHILFDLKRLKESIRRAAQTGGGSTQSAQRSIAVLPFANMSTDAEQEYFCDGITEDITNDLAHVSGLRVAARSSAFVFKGVEADVREIGERLGVEVLLEGSVRKAGSQLRITAQLINVADGYHLWSERYDRELDDVFAIQDEIAHNIVRALEIKLSQGEEQALAKSATDDVVAYEFYLRGRRLFHQKRPAAVRQAIDMFAHAIKSDPGYALAYAGLADCYGYVSLYEDEDTCLEEAFKAGARALELDPELAEAHASRGLTLSLSAEQTDEANEEFERAIGLNPALFEAYYFYGYSCRIHRRWEKAAELFEQAAVINPGDYQVQNHLAMAYKTLNARAKAEMAYRRCLENIERHLERNPEDSRAYQMGAVALIELGERERGLEWGTKAIAMDPENPLLLYNSACVFSTAGDTEQALACLEKAIETGYTNKGAALNDPDLDPIRNLPRFEAIIKRLG